MKLLVIMQHVEQRWLEDGRCLWEVTAMSSQSIECSDGVVCANYKDQLRRELERLDLRVDFVELP